MKPEEFLHTMWICEPPKGTIELHHVTEAMHKYAYHQCAELLESQKLKAESQEVSKVVRKEVSKEVRLSSLNRCTAYACKENDAIIKIFTLDDKIDELHFKIDGDKVWTVVGYKDLQTAIEKALTNFKV